MMFLLILLIKEGQMFGFYFEGSILDSLNEEKDVVGVCCPTY